MQAAVPSVNKYLNVKAVWVFFGISQHVGLSNPRRRETGYKRHQI